MKPKPSLSIDPLRVLLDLKRPTAASLRHALGSALDQRDLALRTLEVVHSAAISTPHMSSTHRALLNRVKAVLYELS